MSDEILSKRTVAVMLILSMLLSVFGTIAVINYLEEYSPPAPDSQTSMRNHNTRVGQLSLEILPAPKEVSTTGYLTLDIQKVEP